MTISLRGRKFLFTISERTRDDAFQARIPQFKCCAAFFRKSLTQIRNKHNAGKTIVLRDDNNGTEAVYGVRIERATETATGKNTFAIVIGDKPGPNESPAW